MRRLLLDTSIVSDAGKQTPSAAIAEWIDAQPAESLYISTFTLAEIWRGIMELPQGRRRNALELWFRGAEGPQVLFAGRLLAFDEVAAFEWGRLIAEGQLAGRPRSPLDMIIAATACANDCIVVTANERHFAGVVEYFNPLRAV